jgi:hypothetical protein
VYSTVTVPTGATLTLNPGTFAITTVLNITGGTVIGAGVTLYFGCTSYPVACASGATGGHLTMSAGALTLSPPTSGTYCGLTVFADRAIVSGNSLSTGTVNVTGTWYTVLEGLIDSAVADAPNFGQLVVASIGVNSSVVVHVTRSSTQSYGTCPSSIGLTL